MQHQGVLVATRSQSFLDSPRGKRLLAVLCAVAFLDFVDASITNVALPHIRAALGFSVQTLQWVPSAYLLTYGGLILPRPPPPPPSSPPPTPRSRTPLPAPPPPSP